MDVLTPIELFLKERKKRNKRRKNKLTERPFIEIRTKSGGQIQGEVLKIDSEQLGLAEFKTRRIGDINPGWYTNPTGRLAIVDRRELEAVFSDSIAAP